VGLDCEITVGRHSERHPPALGRDLDHGDATLSQAHRECHAMIPANRAVQNFNILQSRVNSVESNVLNTGKFCTRSKLIRMLLYQICDGRARTRKPE
jgi:hypothetical protein